MTRYPPSEIHQLLKLDLAVLLAKYRDVSPIEILAVASQVVGMIIAYQDQQTTSVEKAMATVLANIEIGNQTSIEGLWQTEGSA